MAERAAKTRLGWMGRDELDELRRDPCRSSVGGTCALQHRVRRLRQAPSRQARDGVGELRRLRSGSWRGASCRTSRTRRRTCFASCGVERGDRVAVVLPPTPETAAIFFGVWKLGAILLSMSVLYGDDWIRHRLSDSGAKLVVTDARERAALRPARGCRMLVLEADTLAAASTEPVCGDTSAEDPAQLYYTSGTTGLAKGIVHAHRYILGHEEFVYCHEVRTASASTAWANGPGPRESRRCSVLGGSARCSACTGARPASIRTSSSTSSAATR